MAVVPCRAQAEDRVKEDGFIAALGPSRAEVIDSNP